MLERKQCISRSPGAAITQVTESKVVILPKKKVLKEEEERARQCRRRIDDGGYKAVGDKRAAKDQATSGGKTS